MGNLTVRQLEEAIDQVLDAYQGVGKAVPSVSKLKLALQKSSEKALQEFLSEQLAPKAATRRQAGPRAPSAAVSARVEHYKERIATAITNPVELEGLVQTLRDEAKSKKSGTMTKSGLELLSLDLTGVRDKFPSIDVGVDSLRQRIIEKINAKRSLEHSRDHKAY